MKVTYTRQFRTNEKAFQGKPFTTWVFDVPEKKHRHVHHHLGDHHDFEMVKSMMIERICKACGVTSETLTFTPA